MHHKSQENSEISLKRFKYAKFSQKGTVMHTKLAISPMLIAIKSKTKDKDLEIFKIQVVDIILPWVADGVPIYISPVLQ